MAFRITAAHEDDAMVDFEVPLADGEVLEFTVPKLEFLPRPLADKYEAWLKEKLADDEKSVTELESLLKLLELNVPAKQFTVLKKLTHGELKQIEKHWADVSNTTAGESSASDGS